MREQFKYFLVRSEVLPEVFLKVTEAKRLLAQGEAASMSEAARLAGISRSAFYKYKDSVYPYLGASEYRIATIYLELADEPGVLSALLGELSAGGGNILTINQNIPVDGVAPVSVSIRTDKLNIPIESLLEKLRALKGVVEARQLAG